MQSILHYRHHFSESYTHLLVYYSHSSSVYAFFLFFRRIFQPPRSTLFPYTTLFRSRGHRGLSPAAALRPRRRHHLRGRSADRKSTRLNSSHVAISYAVFCLKKNRNTLKNSMTEVLTGHIHAPATLCYEYRVVTSCSN